MAQDTTKADAVLQDHYLPLFQEMVNQRAIMLFGYTPDELEAGFGTANASKGETMDYRGIVRDADQFEFAGRKWVWAAHVGRNESGTMRSLEGATLPTPGEQKYEDFNGTLKYAVKQIEISGFAMEIAERNAAVFVNLLTGETEGVTNDLRKDLNRQAYGNETGALCSITADGANTVTVDSVQYLRVGMYVDAVDSNDDSVDMSNRKITAINQSTKVVTYDGANVDLATDSSVKLCVTGNWKKELTGLESITNSTTYPNLFGVNASTAGNEWWQSVRVDGGAGTFDEDLAQQLLDQVGESGYETELIITTRGIRRRYVNTLKAQKRWNDGNAGKLHGGFKYIDFNDYPMIYDDTAPKGKTWFIRPSDFVWIWLNNNDFRWLNRDGRILRKVESPDQDQWRATIYRYNELAVKRRNCQGQMYNLADDSARVLT